MRYQIVHEDDQHFKIHDTKKQNHFVVAKRGLSAEFIERAQKLCGGGPIKMADGGEVPNELRVDAPAIDIGLPKNYMQTPPEVANQPDISDMSSAIAKVGGVDPYTQDAAPDQQNAPILAQPEMPIQTPSYKEPAAQSPGATPAPQATTALPGLLGEGMSQEIAGINSTARAKAAESQEAAKSYQDYQRHMEDMFKQHNEERAKIDKEQDALMKSYQEGKVNPRRIFENMSTGNKISAAIGLFFGGMGSALTGTPNAALEIMQKAIDRDVDAQKANMSKATTLMHMNMEKYRNVEAAEAATRLQYNTMLQAQLGQSAAKAGSQQALASAQMMIGQLKVQAAPLVNQLAMQTAARKMMGQPDTDPATKIRYLHQAGIMSKEDKTKADSELEKAQNGLRIRDSLIKEFKKAESQNTVLGRIMHLGAKPQAIANIKAMVVPLLKDEAGRVTEPELDRLDELLPAPADSPYKAKQRMSGMLDFIDAKTATPVLTSYGIKPSGGRFDSNGQTRFTEMKPKLK